MAPFDSEERMNSATATIIAAVPTWAANRRQIMTVAKQRFAKFGFECDSLADLADHANVTEPELLRHFRSKHDLLIAICEEGWSIMNPRAAEIMMTSASAREAILAIVTSILHLLDKDPELTRLMLMEGRRTDPATGEIRVSRGYKRFMQMCEDLAVRGQKDGSFKMALEPHLIANMLTGSIEGLLRGRLMAEQAGNKDAYSSTQIVSTFDALVSQLRP